MRNYFIISLITLILTACSNEKEEKLIADEAAYIAKKEAEIQRLDKEAKSLIFASSKSEEECITNNGFWGFSFKVKKYICDDKSKKFSGCLDFNKKSDGYHYVYSNSYKNTYGRYQDQSGTKYTEYNLRYRCIGNTRHRPTKYFDDFGNEGDYDFAQKEMLEKGLIDP